MTDLDLDIFEMFSYLSLTKSYNSVLNIIDSIAVCICFIQCTTIKFALGGWFKESELFPE